MTIQHRRIAAALLAATGLLSLLPTLPCHAAEPSPTDAAVRAVVEREYASLEALYLAFHRSPELSLQEEKTAAALARELRAAGFEVTEKVGGHGVVAVLKNGAGKTLLLRTDLDGLPVKEETGAPYASEATTKDAAGQTVHLMHACGHDVHLTSLVGTVRAMAALKDRWSGTLVLVGQPAEEIVQGARAMLKDGLFTRFPRPDWCLALHVDPELAAGKVGFVPGYAMANVDSVDIIVRGVGGHGAMPHQAKHPVVLASQIVLALQTIASRETSPTDAVVVTVGVIQGGTKRNIIPPFVTMQLTVRTYKDDVRAQVLKSIERIAKAAGDGAGLPKHLLPVVTVRAEESTPALFNEPALVERINAVHRRALGADNVVEREPMMGAEDFSLFGRQDPAVPIYMFRLGAVGAQTLQQHRDAGRTPPGLHSNVFLPDREGSIRTGVMATTTAALDLLAPGK